MRIAVGSDHAGRPLKDLLAEHLRATGQEVEDLGTFTDQSVDYPDYAALVAHAVISERAELGLCCCGTGIGIAIAANKVRGIRAAVVHDVTSARLAREHNDANVICFGARLLGPLVATDALDAFLAAEFLAGRHQQRVEKISQLEKEM